MKRQFKQAVSCLLTLALLLTSAVVPVFAESIVDVSSASLVKQDLDYTENPVDVPNPDRGFERGNDDAAGLGAFTPNRPGGSNYWGYMTVPASADTILGQPFKMAYEMTPPIYFGGEGKGLEYCNVPVEPRIVQFYLVLNNFSSNAWCDSTPGDPSAHTRVGVDGPITQYGLDFIRQQLEFIRTHTNSVAHIRVCYDPKGWNQYVWTADNLKYEDKGPSQDKTYYIADDTKPIALENRAAHIAKPGAGTWRGSSPIFRKCTVPGFTDMNWVQYHYHQLKPIFQEYSDIIWAFDSGTFGPWGESHSNYEAEVPENYKMVLDSLLDAVPDGKPIMTHVGGFLEWYNRTYHTTYTFGTLDNMPARVRGTPEARFGMFDDANAWSADEYSYGDCGSLTEGYRMLAHDPTLPGYNPTGTDPSLTREGVSSVIGYNDSGTNRLVTVPETLEDPRWRGVWFIDWDRTKLENFLGTMSVYGGEQIEEEPDSGTNGGYVPVGERVDNPLNDVILRFPSMFYEHSLAHLTYMCMQQGPGSFKSRADYPYTKDSIGVQITYPWNGQKVQVLYDPVYEGQSALAYYRDRLGYRLVLREAYANKSVSQNGNLTFKGKIQNVGWGDVFNKKAVKVILKSKSNKFVSKAVLTNIDPYDWQPAAVGPNGEMPDSRATNTAAWRDLSFKIPMSKFGNVPAGRYDIYLKINDPKETTANKRSIRFANKGKGIWNEDLGANLIGSTTITAASSSGGGGGGNNSTGGSGSGSTPIPPTTPTIGDDLSSGEASQLASNTFSDVKENAWYAESVGRMMNSGLMNGTTPTTFAPGSLFDRSMIATVLYRLAGSPTVAGSNPFHDVSNGAWYENAVVWGSSNGIITGYNGSYAPSNPITREQVATILYRYAQSTGMDVSAGDSLTGFSDRNDVSDFAGKAMNWAVANGIVNGSANGTLNPKATATRAEVAAMLMRAIDLFQK